MTNHTKMITSSRLERGGRQLVHGRSSVLGSEMPRQPADMVKRMQEESQGRKKKVHSTAASSTAQAHMVDSSLLWWGPVPPAAPAAPAAAAAI